MSRVAQRSAAELSFSREEVRSAATLRGDLGLDWYDVQELLEGFEAEYGVSVSDLANSAVTVGDLERVLSVSKNLVAA